MIYDQCFYDKNKYLAFQHDNRLFWDRKLEYKPSHHPMMGQLIISTIWLSVRDDLTIIKNNFAMG
jgi:hypothetical protein